MALQIDFSPLMNLITSMLPLILILVLIGVIVAVLSKLGDKMNFGIFLALMSIGLLGGAAMMGAFPTASATLSPDSGTLIMGMPSPFTCDGITAATVCHVNVTVGGTTTVAIASVTSNDDGEISFSLIFTAEGSTTVTVGENVSGLGTNAQTGQFDVLDMVGTIVTYVVFIVQIVAVFAVVGIIFALFKKIGK